MSGKWIALTGLLFSAASMGAVGAVANHVSNSTRVMLEAVMIIAFLVCLFLWVHADAAPRDLRLSRLLLAGLLLLPLIFVPIYLIRTRPKGQRAIACIKAAVFLTGLAATVVVSEFITSMLL